jgi:hypothetical protein
MVFLCYVDGQGNSLHNKLGAPQDNNLQRKRVRVFALPSQKFCPWTIRFRKPGIAVTPDIDEFEVVATLENTMANPLVYQRQQLWVTVTKNILIN